MKKNLILTGILFCLSIVNTYAQDTIKENIIDTLFNKDETLKLVSKGNSLIKGEIFAKDNQAPIKGIAIVNINKKQYPPKGSEVMLIPYTDYFKNWLNENKKRAKENKPSIDLVNGASDCIVKTKTTDDNGAFEFKNLMIGKYYLITEFDYIRTKSTTRVEGYTSTYLNGMYIGSTPIEKVYHYNLNDRAFAFKVVEISKENETKKIKLRDTDSLW